MADALGGAGSHLRVQRRRRIGLFPLPRHLRVLVIVIGVARGAARVLHLVSNHRHDDVIGDPSFAWAVIVENVTKPKLALHPKTLSRKDPLGRGTALRKAGSSYHEPSTV